MFYNKLIRDNIPQICEKQGKTAVTRVLNDEEYNKALHDKLEEEMNEYLESRETEELADILEVIECIARIKGISFDELMRIKFEKSEKNGRFEKRLFLTEVKE